MRRNSSVYSLVRLDLDPQDVVGRVEGINGLDDTVGLRPLYATRNHNEQPVSSCQSELRYTKRGGGGTVKERRGEKQEKAAPASRDATTEITTARLHRLPR